MTYVLMAMFAVDAWKLRMDDLLVKDFVMVED
jgi:hypothetical protein